MKLKNKVYEKARLRVGLRHTQVADAVGIKYDALCRWRRGERCPSLDHAVSLARLLRVGVEELFHE